MKSFVSMANTMKQFIARVIEELEPNHLKSRRGVICGVLGAALITTILWLTLFAGTTEQPLCLLFLSFNGFTKNTNNSCQFAVAGSVLTMLAILVLLFEATSIVCIRLTCSE